MPKELRLLIWNRFGEQMYLVSTKKNYTLNEAKDILSYIQKMNHEACSHYELPVYDICKILVCFFDFDMDEKNYYHVSKDCRRELIGPEIKVSYSSNDQRIKNAVCLVELSDFWELYTPGPMSKEVEINNTIGERIKAIVRKKTNAKPWL